MTAVTPVTRPALEGSLFRAMTDAELVTRVLAGEVEAYAGLVARYRDRYARYAWRMLGDADEAEDVLQDALVRAYRGLVPREVEERLRRRLRPNAGAAVKSAGAAARARARTRATAPKGKPR